jgi:hypothetical protein
LVILAICNLRKGIRLQQVIRITAGNPLHKCDENTSIFINMAFQYLKHAYHDFHSDKKYLND